MKQFRIFLYLVLLVPIVIAYDLGVSNNYRYETLVVSGEDCTEDEKADLTGHGIKAKVLLTAIWQDQNSQEKLIKIQVSEPKLLVSKKTAFVERKSDLEVIPTSESFFLLQNNRVEKFWDNPSENSVLRNLKRSVASLLQLKRNDGKEKMDYVPGKCEVFYKVEGKTVRRSVINCHHPLQELDSSQPYGVRSSSIQHSTGIDCDLKDITSGVVSRCAATDRVKTFSNLWKRSSICIHSTSELVFENSEASKEVIKDTDFNKVLEKLREKGELVEGNLYSVTQSKVEHISANVVDSTKNFQDSLKDSNLAKLKSASAFFKLLPIFRSATKKDILKVLENKKFSPVLPQILDLVAASATQDSLEAALAHFAKVKDYDEKLERYLISLSVLPRPESFILKEIKVCLEKGNHNEKIEATLISTLGSLLRTYSNSHRRDSKVVEEILDYLEGSLKKCKLETCVQAYLRGLRNAAQPSSIPLLLKYALKGGKSALEALLAVRNIPSSQLLRQHQELLEKVFHQVGVNQDRSSRAVAAEILLKGNADDDILKSILGSLSDQIDKEFSSFVVSKVLRSMEEDKALRARIKQILAQKIPHYHSLSSKGKSSLFKRQLMSTNGLNATYGIEMELLEGGLLKRSSFDVEFETESGVSNFLSVSMFAEGMGSFAGEESGDDGGDPTAGMELTLLGASLRPYVFFSSTSELMGHAWSGTASTPTPALQGIFPLSDDNHLEVLHNGMVVKLELRGAMSVDMSASIQISLWNRNSQSQVKNSAALLVKGSAVVDADIAKTHGEYLFYGNSAIDFSTDLEFAEAPFKMCLQMEQPNVMLRHDFQRGVEASETKFSVKKTKKRKRFIPSRSFALHQNNNELCRIMKNSDYN